MEDDCGVCKAVGICSSYVELSCRCVYCVECMIKSPKIVTEHHTTKCSKFDVKPLMDQIHNEDSSIVFKIGKIAMFNTQVRDQDVSSSRYFDCPAVALSIEILKGLLCKEVELEMRSQIQYYLGYCNFHKLRDYSDPFSGSRREKTYRNKMAVEYLECSLMNGIDGTDKASSVYQMLGFMYRNYSEVENRDRSYEIYYMGAKAKDDECLIAYAEMGIEDKKWELVEAMFTKFRSKPSNDGYMEYLLGLALEGNGDLEGAVEYFEASYNLGFQIAKSKANELQQVVEEESIAEPIPPQSRDI